MRPPGVELELACGQKGEADTGRARAKAILTVLLWQVAAIGSIGTPATAAEVLPEDLSHPATLDVQPPTLVVQVDALWDRPRIAHISGRIGRITASRWKAAQDRGASRKRRRRREPPTPLRPRARG